MCIRDSIYIPQLLKSKKTIISQLKDEAKYYERIITNLRASRNRFVYAIEDQLEKNRTKRLIEDC